ncbi:MAG: hypothetical protein IH953_10480, partial [Chloroflexi bacterium]|nr:hypothetical protein [Chloroflexota bacterium]
MAEHPGGETGLRVGEISKRAYIEKIRGQLDAERSSFISHWRQLGDLILPRRPRFTITDINKGDRRTRGILDGTATIAARTLENGMMVGMTNPARPWFNMSVADRTLSESLPIRLWLHEVTEDMRSILLRSNFYNVMPLMYGDLGTFGTAAMGTEEDFDKVIRFTMFPIGSYWMSSDNQGRVQVFIREIQKTVRQVIDEYARDPITQEIDFTKVSRHVREQYNENHHEVWINVIQAIIPNEDYDPNREEGKFMKFLSCHYELGVSSGTKNYLNGDTDGLNKFLRVSGFKMFPILAGRWRVNAGDVYGTSCPGMSALPDIKQLQRA